MSRATGPAQQGEVLQGLMDAGYPTEAAHLAARLGVDDPSQVLTVSGDRPAETVIVYSREAARLRLERELTELGYDRVTRRGDRARYEASGSIMPVVDVYTGGRVDVQRWGVVRRSVDGRVSLGRSGVTFGSDGFSLDNVISARKLRGRRTRVLSILQPAIQGWRRTVALEAFDSTLDRLHRSLRSLWVEGVDVEESASVVLTVP